MDNFAPSLSYTREQNNQRSHKHLRKKTLLPSKLKSWGNGKSAEYFPLLSGEDSEEEITLHDLSYLRNRQRNVESKSSNLRYAKRHRHSYSDPFLNCDFMTLELHEGDTLQGIAIKYGCPISDLKRANHIISNQEFYGLRRLKIPVKKYSLLVDILPNDTSGPSQLRDDQRNSDSINTINIGIGPMLNNSPKQEAAAFLKKMDEDLVKIMLNTNSRKDTLEEVTAALSESCIHPLVKNTRTTTSDSIQWSHLLLAIIILAIVVPLILALYMYYSKPTNQPHHNAYLNGTVSPINTTTEITNFSES